MKCKKCGCTFHKPFDLDYVACVNCSTLVDTSMVQMDYKPVKSNKGKKPIKTNDKKVLPEVHINTQRCIDYMNNNFENIKELKLAGKSFNEISKSLEPRNICTGHQSLKKFFMMEHERRIEA